MLSRQARQIPVLAGIGNVQVTQLTPQVLNVEHGVLVLSLRFHVLSLVVLRLLFAFVLRQVTYDEFVVLINFLLQLLQFDISSRADTVAKFAKSHHANTRIRIFK